MSVLDFLGNEILYFDGAMGTRLQAAGLKPGELPEVWNITHGDVVAEIHASYVRAGANILKSNTFGANALKSCLCQGVRRVQRQEKESDCCSQ